MQKRAVTIQLPVITAKWLRDYFSPTTLLTTTAEENELQKQILLTLLTSILGGSHESSGPNR